MSATEPASGGIWARFLQWWIPSPCLSCAEPVWDTRRALGLCDACRGRLRRWPDNACPVCGRLLGAAPPGFRCAACRIAEGHSRAGAGLVAPVLSTWSYEPPLDEVVMALKFRRLDYLGSQLGRAMAEIHRHQLAECEVVMPVPLHWRRRFTRGYNQAELIARQVARDLGLPLVGGLVRWRSTRPQSRLVRGARQRNPAGVFRARRLARWRGCKVLLVDDVVTTGATLGAAAAVLREAGARDVLGLTAARTLRRG